MAGPTVGLFTRGARSSYRSSRWTAQVDEWVNSVEGMIDYVHSDASWRTIEMMQKNCPYRYGWLRQSLEIGRNITPSNPDKVVPKGQRETKAPDWDAGKYRQIVFSGTAQDKLVAYYRMVYARRLEFGFTGTDSLGRYYNQAPRAWVRRAAQNYKKNFEAAVIEARRVFGEGIGKTSRRASKFLSSTSVAVPASAVQSYTSVGRLR